MNGIRVDAFKIGFGPRILSWVRGETEYGLNLIPFGGYVKIHGEDPDEESLTGVDKERSFANKNRLRQATVLVAGVFFNFIFACLLYIIIFASGVTVAGDVFPNYAEHQYDPRVLITHIEPGSPAEDSGLIVGDTIVGVGNLNKEPAENISKIETIQNNINDSAGKDTQFTYSRNGQDYSVNVIPINSIVEGKYAIGITMSDVVDMRLPILSSIYEGFRYTGIMIWQTTVGLISFFADIFRGQADFATVTGPIGIAGIVGDAASMGIIELLMITAIISINLGVINLLPFPALDGGRLLFVIIEGVIRRRIPSKFTNIVNTVGFVLLMILMLIVTYKDIFKLLK
jgi:regulator of sigma E protease